MTAWLLPPNPPIHTDASKRRCGLLARVIGTRWASRARGRIRMTLHDGTVVHGTHALRRHKAS